MSQYSTTKFNEYQELILVYISFLHPLRWVNIIVGSCCIKSKIIYMNLSLIIFST
jgi:hypothetical protein